MKTALKMTAAAATLSLCLSAPAVAKDADRLLADRLAADAANTPTHVPYRYTLTMTASTTDEPDIRARFAVDATQPPGSRVKLVEARYSPVVAGDDNAAALPSDPTEIDDLPEDVRDRIKEIEGYDAAAQADDFWCTASVADTTAQPLTPDMFERVEDGPDHVRYRITREALSALFMSDAELQSMGSSERKLARRLIKRLDGEVQLSKPDGRVAGYSFRMTRPMRILMIARLHRADFDAQCMASPVGPPHVARLDGHVTLGLAGERIHSQTTEYRSDLVHVGARP